MKLSVSIYSFMQYIKSDKLTVLQCISKAKEMGFEAVEFVDFLLGDAPDKKPFAS